jgi:hypothetical protein
MTLRITAALTTDLRGVLAAEVAAGQRAARNAVADVGRWTQEQLRNQVRNAFGTRSARLANTWRLTVYPTSAPTLRPAALVSSRAPTIMDAFDRGAVIRPKGTGKFLAIPTGFNRQGGRRGAKPRVTPEQMVASQKAFIRPFKSGRGFVWCLPVRQGERTGRGRAPLIAGGIVAVATARRKGAAAWQQSLLAQGFVPMFLLLPQVRVSKRLDIAAVARAASARMETTLRSRWSREA